MTDHQFLSCFSVETLNSWKYSFIAKIQGAISSYGRTNISLTLMFCVAYLVDKELHILTREPLSTGINPMPTFLCVCGPARSMQDLSSLTRD